MFWNFNNKIDKAAYTITFFYAEAHIISKSNGFNETDKKNAS